MLKELSVNSGNFLLSLSDAIDLSGSTYGSHQQKLAYIVWQMGNAAKLSKEAIEKIFIAALFHNIGILAIEDKIRERRVDKENLDIHCILGELLFEFTPLLKPSAKVIRYHHRPWNEWDSSIESPYVIESQILCLANMVELSIKHDQFILNQVDRITKDISSSSGSIINPNLADLFMTLSKREDFWLDLVSPRLYSLLINFKSFQNYIIGYDTIYSMTLLVRSIIDFRSIFTATHSAGVAECAGILSELFGFSEYETKLIKIAANLHDLGKLAIPDTILNKPDVLTEHEFNIVKQHPYFTYSILNTIQGFDQISKWAAFHHEKQNGSGYPFQIPGGMISTGSRIMAVADIFSALSEDRPYRKSMNKKAVNQILTDHVNNHNLDSRIVFMLLENQDEILFRMREKQNISKTYYNEQVAMIDEQTPE